MLVKTALLLMSTWASVARAATYKVTFTQKDSPDDPQTIECPGDDYLLDCAEEAGYDWPYSSRAGADASSAAKLTSGTVDQSDQSFLDDDQVEAGYILTDVAYPTSDVVIVIGVEDELY